jgi:hypothetical protein
MNPILYHCMIIFIPGSLLTAVWAYANYKWPQQDVYSEFDALCTAEEEKIRYMFPSDVDPSELNQSELDMYAAEYEGFANVHDYYDWYKAYWGAAYEDKPEPTIDYVKRWWAL